MKLKLDRKGVALGLVVGLLGGAAGGALATSGGTKTTTTTTGPSATRQAVVDAFLSDLASKLGVSVDTLKADVKAAAIDQVNAAVASGKLTQDQANAIIARIDAGGFPALGLGGGPGPGFGFGHRGGFGFRVDVLSVAASYLGTTVSDLQTQLRSGKSLADIAGSSKVSGLEDAIVAAVTKDVNANANLTSDQKAQILANLKAQVDRMVTRTPGAGRWGGPPAMQGMMRGGAAVPLFH